MAESMRVMASTGSGFEIQEIPKPDAGPGEVRIRVVSSALNAGEEKVIRGDFVGRFLHAKTSPLVVGWDFAGRVDALGESITDLEKDSPVWGHLAYSSSQKQGAQSEYITVPRETVATKPDSVPYDLAAATATVAMTSLQSLRDEGRLSTGQDVLVIGAAGGIGSVAVGIGKRLGARVTAVCSTKDVERVQALGADIIVDRKTEDPLGTIEKYNVVFDTPAVYSYGRFAKILLPGGAYVTTLPGATLVTGMLRALISSKRCRFVQVASKREDLELVGEWLVDGLAVPIDSSHNIADLGVAMERQKSRERSGKVVLNVADGWAS